MESCPDPSPWPIGVLEAIFHEMFDTLIAKGFFDMLTKLSLEATTKPQMVNGFVPPVTMALLETAVNWGSLVLKPVSDMPNANCPDNLCALQLL